MLLQMILDSRGLMDVPDGITHRMGSLRGLGDPSRSTGPATSAAGKEGGGMDAEDCGAVFAQRIGVIFCALFNMFVDAEVLATIRDVAGRLAASAASPAEWASTELGSFVHFSDDRSQDRVRKIWFSYIDGSLQDNGVFMKIRQERSAFLAKYMPKGKKLNFVSRAMGLASCRLPETMEASSKMRRQYLREGILDPFPLLREDTPAKRRGPCKLVNPLLLVTERKGAASSLHYGAFPLDAFNTGGGEGSRVTSIPTSIAQEAWLSTALEELAQMCGALLRVTATSNADSSAGSRLSINVHVGDALNFCDTLLACASPAWGSADADGDAPKESATRGIINVVVASAPLLKAHRYAVLLTSFISTSHVSSLFQGTQEFYEKLLCMNSHTAAVLLGGPSNNVLVDISPRDFVNLTLPVYKEMFGHMPKTSMLASRKFHLPANEALRSATLLKYYTSVSFGRLLSLAGRRLRLRVAHFDSVLGAIIDNSGLILAPNLMQEQMAVFHALGLAPIRQPIGAMFPIPRDLRRVVLLVPKAGLSLLREFTQPELYLALAGTLEPFENFFVSVHTVFVRVRRGGKCRGQEDLDGWSSLNSHLMVRDTREQDPEAELMVSAMVPSFALMMAPPAFTELQLRPRDGIEVFQAPKSVIRRLGGYFKKHFFKATLDNADKTAVLIPGATGDILHGGVSRPRFSCPDRVACPDQNSSRPSPPMGRGLRKAVDTHRFMHGDAAIDQAVELVQQAGSTSGDARLVYRVTLVMANDEARQCLAAGGAPVLETLHDPFSVRVALGEGLGHATGLPFPIEQRRVQMEYSKRQGYVIYTVPPVRQPLNFPLAWTGLDIEGVGKAVLPSMPFWSPAVPLSSLPRLDFQAEWAHQKEEILAIISTACEHHDEAHASSWKHPWMCITENRRDDEPALWVWVNEILLDSTNEALILDCCVMLADRMDSAASILLGTALELDIIQGRGAHIRFPKVSIVLVVSAQHSLLSAASFCCDIHPVFVKAVSGGVALWGSLLPAAVERARQTYAHTADCIYPTPGYSGRTLCSCGMGKDLPPGFVESMRSAKLVPLQTCFHRAALSPLFPAYEKLSTQFFASGTAADGSRKCAKCGKSGKPLQCSRCRNVSYCSKECQRQDWKSHKPSCR
ncbi:unnamed protein product [Ectocarpus sp. CCAP 1310/34]|nr:unnamed protein product [Ectocarpus sp. CCAP 1310/34]